MSSGLLYISQQAISKYGDTVVQCTWICTCFESSYPFKFVDIVDLQAPPGLTLCYDAPGMCGIIKSTTGAVLSVLPQAIIQTNANLWPIKVWLTYISGILNPGLEVATFVDK